ncbi:MAG: hypothetical protein FJY66_02460 [Calditrichaeota bacterium]|nr:hypothetical protein [Calditrichota bacterium]
MKSILWVFFVPLTLSASLSAAPRLVIDVGQGRQDTLPGAVVYVPTTDSAAPRLVIDPSQLPLQFSLDSVMLSAEEKIRHLVVQTEGIEGDTAFERRLGELIGKILLERELALLNLQVQSAKTSQDSLLLSGLRLVLEELFRQNPQLQEMLLREALR